MRKISLKMISFILVFMMFMIVGCGEESKTYTVSFNTDGGLNIDSVVVQEGSSFQPPVTPTKADYTFTGWYMDKELTTLYDFNSQVNKDTVLYAKWVRKIIVYTVNDFHGAIEDRARQVAGYIMSNKNKNINNTIVISAGDMLQGSGISNLRYGLDTINIMNIIGFDAMTTGNHEFDWSIEKVLEYFDDNEDNGEANFPLLGCNIIDKRTNTLPTNMQEYTIIEKNGLKIAVIGYIGLGLESDIATKMVENYEFVSPLPIISELSRRLRTEEDVDIVIACGHDASDQMNSDIANLSGDSRVDAIVNGHTHVKANGTIVRNSDGYRVPYIQADDSGNYVGKIELTFDPKENKVISGSSVNNPITNSTTINEEVDAYVDKLVEETAPVFNRVIGVSGKQLNQSSAAEWACNIMVDYVKGEYGECDLAFTNLGGIRNVALPIYIDEEITVGRIHQLMPFDNAVKVVTLKGSIVRNLITLGGELKFSTATVTQVGNTIYINGVLLDDNATYRVAAVDYIFDKESYPFLNGDNIVSTFKLIRDIMIESIELSTANNNKCF